MEKAITDRCNMQCKQITRLFVCLFVIDELQNTSALVIKYSCFRVYILCHNARTPISKANRFPHILAKTITACLLAGC